VPLFNYLLGEPVEYTSSLFIPQEETEWLLIEQKHQNSFSALFRYGVLGVALVYSWYGSKPTFGSFHILRFRGQWLSQAQRYEQSCCFPILSLWEFYPKVLQRSLLRQ
jgi:hypothetical protein